VYDCGDGYSLTVRIEDKKAWLFLPNKTMSLPLVPSQSGAKYSKGQIAFWSKGDEALLEIGEERRAV
jgi:membrane-bound inhibitor of C-type lysozyme